jgi:hypothetical protein
MFTMGFLDIFGSLLKWWIPKSKAGWFHGKTING